jgi:hypothetical protein
MALRSALHQAGAAALIQLPTACCCSHQARYRELRSRRVVTAVGESRRACGACMLWSGSKHRSIMAANR